MKFLLFTFFCLFSFFPILKGAEADFHPDPLTLNGNQIYVISTFEEVDYFTCYDCDGNLVWEFPFNSKINSWKSEGGLLFIFSKNRSQTAFFLTCIDPAKAQIVWERGILAPC